MTMSPDSACSEANSTEAIGLGVIISKAKSGGQRWNDRLEFDIIGSMMSSSVSRTEIETDRQKEPDRHNRRHCLGRSEHPRVRVTVSMPLFETMFRDAQL